MAATTLVSMEQYLRTSYRPDVEFIDGELREKAHGNDKEDPMVQWVHARLQVMIGSWFDQQEEEWGVLAGVEARTQVSLSRVRLPDVVVVKAGSSPQTLVDPPLIVIEILSPSDTHSELEARVRDYVEMGVPNVWMIDPQQRVARVCHGTSWTEVTRFEVHNSPIYVDVPALFARLDKYDR